jgi:hypothetical protein
MRSSDVSMTEWERASTRVFLSTVLFTGTSPWPVFASNSHTSARPSHCELRGCPTWCADSPGVESSNSSKVTTFFRNKLLGIASLSYKHSSCNKCLLCAGT